MNKEKVKIVKLINGEVLICEIADEQPKETFLATIQPMIIFSNQTTGDTKFIPYISCVEEIAGVVFVNATHVVTIATPFKDMVDAYEKSIENMLGYYNSVLGEKKEDKEDASDESNDKSEDERTE